MKMAYNYAKMTAFYSVESVPECWEYPAAILMQVRMTDQTDPLVLEGPTAVKGYVELVPGYEYQTLLP
jgi:hypothetical protein